MAGSAQARYPGSDALWATVNHDEDLVGDALPDPEPVEVSQ